MSNKDMNDNQPEEEAEAIEENRQFLTFSVENSVYALDIMTVREIKGWTEATRIPNSPEYMRGVINLRGVVIPVYDLKCRFGNGTTEADDKNVVIYIAAGGRTLGILVDAVSDILTVKASQVRPAPSSSPDIDIDDAYVSGLIGLEENMVIVLDVEHLVSSSVTDKVAAASAA
ncbi:MAG: purine-binding chemotaxis protein CheW [Hyphomicrobiales bacterium]|nr:purine-binding chemotaxis protein CheW [Rickettsiales bacterium]MCP5361815.1 purine-binding chemotaxis protein CheW [Hyphomicrobiales bacterium]